MQQPTLDIGRSRSSAFWWGFLIILLAVGSNLLYFKNVLKIPLPVIPWINLVLPIIGVLLLCVGLARMWPGVRIWAKILGSFFAVVSVALLALSVWGFVHARAVPASAGAPKVGQKAPDFTLTDTSGHSVSLAQLLSSPTGNSSPKAVLLVFYRGYW